MVVSTRPPRGSGLLRLIPVSTSMVRPDSRSSIEAASGRRWLAEDVPVDHHRRVRPEDHQVAAAEPAT